MARSDLERPGGHRRTFTDESAKVANGGYVVAAGSTIDWAESDSEQVTMNLQFVSMQNFDEAILVTDQAGNVIFAYDPDKDETAGTDVGMGRPDGGQRPDGQWYTDGVHWAAQAMAWAVDIGQRRRTAGPPEGGYPSRDGPDLRHWRAEYRCVCEKGSVIE